VTVRSRLSPEVQRDIVARPSALVAEAALDDLPPLRLRGGDSLLGWLLVGGSAAILLGLGLWLAWRLRPRREAGAAVERAGVEEEPLPAALALVEAALSQDEPERRVALDALARRLDESGETDLAREARRLAWSETGPETGLAAALAAAVRARVGEAA
jgi:hypothetical protein